MGYKLYHCLILFNWTWYKKKWIIYVVSLLKLQKFRHLSATVCCSGNVFIALFYFFIPFLIQVATMKFLIFNNNNNNIKIISFKFSLTAEAPTNIHQDAVIK